MKVPYGTKVEITTTNGGYIEGKTYGSTEIGQASDGIVVIGGVTVAIPGPNGAGVSIPSFRIESIVFPEGY